MTAPVLDTIMTAAGVGLFIAGAAIYKPCKEGWCMDQSYGLAGLLAGGGTAALFGASAYYGYWKTSQCRDAVACTNGNRAACQELRWPPPRSAPAATPPSP